MRRALERYDEGAVSVIPVILKPVEWRETALGRLQVLPKDARPVVCWAPRDSAFQDTARGIRDAIRHCFAIKGVQPTSLTSMEERPSYVAPPVLTAPCNERTKHNVAGLQRLLVTVEIPGLLIAVPAFLAFMALLAMFVLGWMNTAEVVPYIALLNGILGLLSRLMELLGMISPKRGETKVIWRFVTGYAVLIVAGTILLAQANRISIASVNQQTCGKSRSSACEVGFENTILGTYQKSVSTKAYVVVRPDNDSQHWFIQYPAPVTPLGANNWTGAAFLGTTNAGVGVTFEVYAILTSDEYKAEQRLNSEPKGNRSKTVYCTRTR